MTRIAPVRLSFNPKTLWFDALDFDLKTDDAVVVQTARGLEFGHVSKPIFEMEYEETKSLKSPLKNVVRLANDEDIQRADKAAELSAEALPIFRQMAAIYAPDMNPVAVEYLFDGDKAVFYFDAEERIDFRDLVRKLASELQVRVDMKQIGVRDGARMVGGLGHCGQELCCARLGGDFNPVSIRMAKEQDLSLNPQKISGICGRLMCCLRYEFEAYKDFHSRAPKKNARITTPDGEGKVVDLDVPREIVSIKVGDEKPVKVPLADMDAPEEGNRPKSVGAEAWEAAQAPTMTSIIESSNLFTSQLSGEDELAEPGKVTHMYGEEEHKSSRRRRKRGGSNRSSADTARNSTGSEATQEPTRKQRRRRSTTVSSDGTTQLVAADAKAEEQRKPADEQGEQKRPSRRRRRGGQSQKKQKQQMKGAGQVKPQDTGKSSKVGRNSSALRTAARHEASQTRTENSEGSPAKPRHKRRTHTTSTDDSA